MDPVETETLKSVLSGEICNAAERCGTSLTISITGSAAQGGSQAEKMHIVLASETPPKVPAVQQAMRAVLDSFGLHKVGFKLFLINCAGSAGVQQPLRENGTKKAARARSEEMATRLAKQESLAYIDEDGSEGVGVCDPKLKFVMESGMMAKANGEGVCDRCYCEIRTGDDNITASGFGQESDPVKIFEDYELFDLFKSDTKNNGVYRSCLKSVEELDAALKLAAKDTPHAQTGGITLGLWMWWLIQEKAASEGREPPEFDHKDWMALCEHGKSRYELLKEQIKRMLARNAIV